MSLKSLPFVQRIHALKKEVINKIHERKELEKDKIQQAEVKSIGYRECWPIDQLKKIKQSLLPSLTHDNDGISVFDAKAPYVYGDEEPSGHGGMFGMGEPNTAYAQYFIGNSYLKPLAKSEESKISIANVTFEPGCRNNWHIHHAKSGGGQMLICVEGEGWYQEEGKTAQSLHPGDVVIIPANVKHWHGAKKDSWFSHLAVEVPGEETSNEWCEPVTNEEYERL